MDKFVLKRKIRRFKQGDSDRPKIYIRPETYNILCEWAIETGQSLADVTEMAVDFAGEHLVWDCEE